MTQKRNEITYVGWLGYGNIGDEALYLSTQKIFSSYRFVSRYERPSSKITLFGGGTVLPIWTLGVLPNKYNYAFGVGVRNPAFWGDFHPFVVKLIKRFKFRYLGVRGKISQELLRNWGIDSEVIGDPCLLLEPKSYKKEGRKMVAVNVGASREKIWGGDEERVLRETIKLCRLLRKDGFYPVLIPFWKNSVPYIKRISEAANVSVFEKWEDVQCVLNFIARCHILIGQKLHSTVFSASTYTPFISLEYRPKCRDFSETMDFGKYTIRTDRMTSKGVMNLFNDLLENWEEMRSRLIRNVEIYRKKLKESAARIINDIESLPDDKWSALGLLRYREHKILFGTDVFLYKRMNNIWRAWYRLPIKKSMDRWLDLLQSSFWKF